jgi:hypothetical protein
MNELEHQFEKVAGDLATELAIMHGTLFTLIIVLRNTELTKGQAAIINAAENKLQKSQQNLFATYADMVGGADTERK